MALRKMDRRNVLRASFFGAFAARESRNLVSGLGIDAPIRLEVIRGPRAAGVGGKLELGCSMLLERPTIAAYVRARDGIGCCMTRASFFSRGGGPAGPRGHRAYAIGDVHGCLSLLERLLARIEQEIDKDPKPKTSIVFLGDVVDRGPASAQVVERLRTYAHPRASTHFVMGNHEEVMLRVIEGDSDLLTSWLRFGGRETLASYGLDPKEVAALESDELEACLKQAIPASHRAFLAGFSDSISFGDYLFVHAGIRPGIDLAEQSQSDLRWIRDAFLYDSTDHGFVVVHGHTISNSVDVAENRIGIDTGAFCTGVLTALAIEGSRTWLIQASEDGTERLQLEQ